MVEAADPSTGLVNRSSRAQLIRLFVIFGDRLQQKPRKKMIAAFHFDNFALECPRTEQEHYPEARDWSATFARSRGERRPEILPRRWLRGRRGASGRITQMLPGCRILLSDQAGRGFRHTQATMAASRLTGSTSRSRSIRLGRWLTEIGRWRPISMSALTTSRRKRWARSSRARPAGPSRRSRR